jgi:hypothetical protein
VVLNLKRVAPGTFFALFGCLLVSGVWFSRVDARFTRNDRQTGTQQEVDQISLANGAEATKASKSLVRMLNTALLIADGKSPAELAAIASELNQHRERLRALRDDLIAHSVSGYAVKVWYEHHKAYAANPTNVPRELRETIGATDPWFEETVTDE